jgi:hypothetical protein
MNDLSQSSQFTFLVVCLVASFGDVAEFEQTVFNFPCILQLLQLLQNQIID